MPHPIHVSVVQAGPPEAEIISLQTAIRFLRITTSDPNTTGNEQDDNLIRALTVGAREMIERHLWRSIAKRDFVQYMDTFPHHHYDSYGAVSGARRVYMRGSRRARQEIKLWYPPLVNCEQIIYIGLDGAEHTLVSGTDFQVDYASEPARIYPLQSQFWPETMYGVVNAVRIPFTAGYEVQSAEEPEGQSDIEAVPEPETSTVSNVSATQQVVSYTIDRTIPQPIATAVEQLMTHWWLNRSIVVAQAGAGGKFRGLPWHIEQQIEAYRCWDYSLNPETD